MCGGARRSVSRTQVAGIERLCARVHGSRFQYARLTSIWGKPWLETERLRVVWRGPYEWPRVPHLTTRPCATAHRQRHTDSLAPRLEATLRPRRSSTALMRMIHQIAA